MKIMKRIISTILAVVLVIGFTPFSEFADLDWLAFSFTADAASGTGGYREFNGHYYEFFSNKLKWHDAKIFCENLGGHLVTITSKAENDFLLNNVKAGDFAIGLTDEVNEGKWQWVTGEEYNYSNWSSGEPNNQGNEDYALMKSNGKWNDGHLERENWSFVCEWDGATAVDIDSNPNYGLCTFTVVNAQTKDPIQGASLYIYTPSDGESTFFTDAEGKVSVVLPVGTQQVSAYAEGCLERNLRIHVKSGEQEIPLIGLSDQKTYDAKIETKEMTLEEIEAVGIDTTDPANKHVFKYELHLEFTPEIDWESIAFYWNGEGGLAGWGSGSGSGSPWGGWLYLGPGTPSHGSGTGTPRFYNPRTKTSVVPVSEYFYIIIRGEVSWLKEMFDVEMLVYNNSMTDTLENMQATLELPEGISLAAMKEKQQTLVQQIGTVPEGESKSVHWYVRGDTEGDYAVSAMLDGMVMPFEEEIHDRFVGDDLIHVWAGNALRLHFEFPDAAFTGQEYPVTVTLTNVSNKSLYHVTSLISDIEQGRVTYYSDGHVEKEVYINTGFVGSEFVEEFKPGDKLVIQLDITILFESVLMNYYKEQAVGFVDGIEQLMKAVNMVQTAESVFTSLVGAVKGCSKALDNFMSNLSPADEIAIGIEKMKLARELWKNLSSLRKYTTTGNKVADRALDLMDASVINGLDMLTKNPAEFLKKATLDEIDSYLKKVKALGNAIAGDSGASTRRFNIYDSIRTAIRALPVRFVLRNVFLIEDEANTTSIPWSYSVTHTGPQYFGVSNVSKYIANLAKAACAEIYNANVPSLVKLIPGLDDPFNYETVKQEIQAVEDEIAAFQAMDTTGTVRFTAWVERASSATRVKKSAAANDLCTLQCTDNETSVVQTGRLSFTGEGSIEVIPHGTQPLTLHIEDNQGNEYVYDLQVVPQHVCKGSKETLIIAPTEEHKGYAARCCDVCGDVLEIIEVDPSDCDSHDFDEWKTVSSATCTAEGIETRTCTNCKITEIRYTPTVAHQYDETQGVAATCTEKGTATYTCVICGVSYSEEIDALGHNFGVWVQDGDNHVRSCLRCEEKETATHVWGDAVVIPATCQTKGTITYTCTECGAVKNEIIPETNHQCGASVKENETYATCTEAGKYEMVSYCEYCGIELSREAFDVAALGHSFTNYVYNNDATTECDGTKTAQCDRCDVTDTITAPGTKIENPPVISIHNWVESRTIDYRTTITFSADPIQNPVDGASVHWFINGQDKGASDTYTEKEAKATFTVQAKYMKGNTILAESEIETVNVKTGFFAKLKAFFRALFKKLPKVVQEYLGVEIIDRVLP